MLLLVNYNNKTLKKKYLQKSKFRNQKKCFIYLIIKVISFIFLNINKLSRVLKSYKNVGETKEQ